MKPQTSRIGIFGKSGCGKSTFAKQTIKTINRLIVYDPLGEYQNEGCVVVRNVSELLRAARSNHFKIAYQPGIEANHVKELAAVAKTVFLIQKPYSEGRNYPQITLLIEEMSQSVPNFTSGDTMVMQNVANMGRHAGINLIGISQRPANVNTTFRGCLIDTYYFALEELNDIEAVAQRIGRENAHKLLRYPPHHAIHYREGKTELHVNAGFKNLLKSGTGGV